MYSKTVVTAAALVACLTTGAFAQAPALPAVPLLQAVSPDGYTKLSIDQRQFYVAGALDTDRVLFEQTKPLFAACLQGITIARATEIVDRGLTTLEPMLRSSMPIAVHNALLMDCDRRGFKSS
ncbi:MULTISPECIES: hypothetical protein [Caballeronia]|uniref:Uncharacterized protein n=1 Tax=Caballeronia zhejiangensis TaxID=871203 RepID=A0A656QKS7_9BURK|nr:MULTISPECIES: hypothetical protein [Caballeronia]KDR28534.1 hypothetical protein BG60_11280 [Caballeronia zhejiangensis]MCE4547879.1 hypothetical protein [Caballeronia sp. PC1]MCE4575567.1 hypothetical protein [Caballeronia sp. CLC5]